METNANATATATAGNRLRFLVAEVRGESYRGEINPTGWHAFEHSATYQGIDSAEIRTPAHNFNRPKARKGIRYAV